MTVYQRTAFVAVAVAALTADVARTGWMAAAAGYVTIAATAVVLLDAAIATSMAPSRPGQAPRGSRARRSVTVWQS